MPAYSKTTWIDGSAPAIDATNLNKIEQGIFDSLRQDGSTTMSGQLVTTAGTVTTPAIAPTGDSNTGIFFPAADTIAFGEGGGEAMRINSSGQVGIGTTNPAYKLDVKTGTASFEGSSGVDAIRIAGAGGSWFWLDNPTSSTFRISSGATAGTNPFILTSAGNVGIGTTSPTNKLQIEGVTANTSCINAVANTTAGQSFGIALSAGSNSSDYALNIRNATQTTQLFHVAGNGNVGIGTGTPSAKLEVAGTKILLSGSSVNSTIGVSDSSCNYNFNLFTQSADIAQLSVINKTIASGSKDLWITASSHNFNVWNGSAYTTRALIDTNGYMLIGYTSSNGAYPLQVNGQIFATSSTIATSDGRYKKDVVALDGALDIVKALNPVQFSWKEHPVHKFNTDVPTVGFIAQEVEQALADKSYLTSIIKKSECTWETETGEFVEREVTRDVEKQVTREVEREVTETIDGEEVTRTVTEEITETVIEQVTEIVSEPVKETHTEEFLGIAESNLIAILTKAVKELAQEVEALKAELAK